jgi:CheY-like chemotaxis protein
VHTPTPDFRARPIRILYADDVPELRHLVHAVFSLDHHMIECVEDGVEALERIDRHRDGYDLLITDHHMPRMNGLELVRELRALPFSGRVMVFTSELDPGVTREYQQLGVDRILLKPLYPADLRQIVRELFPETASVTAG